MNNYDLITYTYAYKKILEIYLCKFLGTVYDEFQYKKDNNTIHDGGYYGSDFFGLGIVHCFQKNISKEINSTYVLIKDIDAYYETMAKSYLETNIGTEIINTELHNLDKSTKNKSTKKRIKLISQSLFYYNTKFNYLSKLSKDYLLFAKEKNKMFIDIIYGLSCVDFLDNDNNDNDYEYLCNTYRFHTMYEIYCFEWLNNQYLNFDGNNCKNKIKQ